MSTRDAMQMRAASKTAYEKERAVVVAIPGPNEAARNDKKEDCTLFDKKERQRKKWGERIVKSI